MTGIIITMNPEELREMVAEAVSDSLSKSMSKQQKYLSRFEVAEMLKVSLPTIHAYVNSGILKAEKIGGRTLFNSSTIEEAVREKKVYKYKHERRG